MMNERIWQSDKIAYGGDYNPEQWDESTWAEDMRLLKLAHIDTVTLNVFSWASLQPGEDTYDFSRLDKIMEMVRANGLKVILATSKGASHIFCAADRDLTAAELDDAVHDGQADSVSASLAARSTLIVFFKNVCLGFFVHSGTAVCKGKGDPFFVGSSFDGDFPVFGCKFDGVAD